MDIFPPNMAEWALYAAIIYGFLLAFLAVEWCLSLGVLRGSLAWLCRVSWTIPLVAMMFPKTEMEPLPRSVALKSIRVLVDDSRSMQTKETPHFLAQGMSLIKDLEAECLRLGCALKTTMLSDLDPIVKKGFTPLNEHLDPWIYKNPQDPWILVSDGADSKPTENWQLSLRGSGASAGPGVAAPRGVVVGFQDQGVPNLWIKAPSLVPFSFENKPLTVRVTLGRSHSAADEVVQVQVTVSPQPPATFNVKFKAGESEVLAETILPALPKGQHLVELRALPTATEEILWDNVTYSQIEVLPNTFGVLHLLGSPSWDGRFLRRYLKGEPKYDLISFFILRDPWDSQQVNERELSLIPFPVERLFRDELPNFRVVIIQNFTMFQFLLPEYQANLVKFVQNGGGLLFMGGPRALTASDLVGSPLKAILPFELDDKISPGGGGGFGAGLGVDAWDNDLDMENPKAASDLSIAYDPNLNFHVELAVPEAKKRALANVYDDWENLAPAFAKWTGAKGIHRMDRARFRDKDSTVLLYGIPSGSPAAGKSSPAPSKIPLAVASYPGRGRALWLFSDSFWRLGMTLDQGISRQIYNQFMHSAMTWLMRQDLKKPLIAQSLSFSSSPEGVPIFKVALQGPSVRYFQASDDWQVKACGSAVASGRLLVQRQSETEVEVSAPLPHSLRGGSQCEFVIEGNHPAFGFVKATLTGVYPETYRDSDLRPVPHKLADLTNLTGAKLILIDRSSQLSGTTSAPSTDKPSAQGSKDALLTSVSLSQASQELILWLGQVTGHDGVSLPMRFRSLQDYYWILNSPWIFLTLLFIPLEVIIRRWDHLVAGK